MDFFVKNTKTQIQGKTSGFVNTNPREFENLYILLGFINTVWISKSIKIYKPITPPKIQIRGKTSGFAYFTWIYKYYMNL